MISAVDSSVILDVLTDSRAFVESSVSSLRQGAQEGRLVVCECVLADWQREFVSSDPESAILAGEIFTRSLRRSRGKGKVLADFLIGAHALVHADRLIARDRGFFRDYFSTLVVWDPSV